MTAELNKKLKEMIRDAQEKQDTYSADRVPATHNYWTGYEEACRDMQSVLKTTKKTSVKKKTAKKGT